MVVNLCFTENKILNVVVPGDDGEWVLGRDLTKIIVAKEHYDELVFYVPFNII